MALYLMTPWPFLPHFDDGRTFLTMNLLDFPPEKRSHRLLACLLLPLALAACTTLGGGQAPVEIAPVPAMAASAAAPVVATAVPPAMTASASSLPLAPANAASAVAVPQPVDPLRPEVRPNLNDNTAQTDLWARVRRGFAMPNLTGELVRSREQSYAQDPEYVQRMTERGGRYLFHIVEELERRRMPTELALLPIVESAFNPQATSHARASGMWQFMPKTGKHFDLKQNIFRDDRRDVLASTRAALDYLSKLHTMFGDWHLALAAYNWGEGSVQRAISQNRAQGLPTNYASLRMPNETRLYVPKLQAVKNIVARPADFAITLPPLRNHPYFLSVPIDRDLDVAMALKLSGLPLGEFQTLNPQMNKPVILAAGTPQILLPYDNANQFVRELAQHRGPLASWTAWVAPQNLHPAEAARRVGMHEWQLREVNRIPPHMLVKAGSTLLVPRNEQRLTDVSIDIADNATMALAPDAPPVRKLALRAGRKDSVASVARRYRVSPTQVAQWNRLPVSARFKPGQTVVMYVATSTRHSATRHRVAHRRGGASHKIAAAHRHAKSSTKRVLGRSTGHKRRVRMARR
jgi:membrane-bound lytic murein transglycosylase D